VFALAGVFDSGRGGDAPLALHRPGASRALRQGVDCALDGRIANLGELARSAGLDPSSEPAGVVAALYARVGEAVLARLRGEFALLLWDQEAGRGLIARDQLGARALHYRRAGDRLVFGSEVRDVLELLPRRPGPDRLAVCHWLAMSDVRGGRTFFEGVTALPPGHAIRLGGAESGAVWRWWAPCYEPPLRLERDDAVAAIRERLEVAVERACGAERVGVLMSGGLDSTGVAALAARVRPGATAYSGVFPSMDSVDESELIDVAAGGIGIESVREEIFAGAMLSGAAAYPAEWQLPLRPQNLGPWMPLLRRAADDGARVLLDGEGGDLLFSAPRELVADRLRRGRVLSALRLARRLPGVAATPGATRYVMRVHGLRAAVPPGWHSAVRARRDAGRYVPPWLRQADARAVVESHGLWAWKRVDGRRWWARLADALGGGLHAVGIRDHLRRRAAMVGLESRSPFFDVDLVELVLRLPPELAFHPELTRPLQREAMRGLLPDPIRLRPSKSYFDELFQRSLAVAELAELRALLGAPDAELGAFVDLERVRRELVEPAPARHPRGIRFWLNGAWRLATAECWLRAEAGRPLPAALRHGSSPRREPLPVR
jgi:asparagine synthase (glutamine-hydrolysing)